MTSQTLTLSEFLLARISEDEGAAKAASPGPWHLNAEHDEVLAVDDIAVCDGFALSGPQTRATTQHIARHDPARVLAECEAKRRIVEDFVEYDRAYRNAPSAFGEGRRFSAAMAVGRLAELYADHPDYRDEWRA